MANFDTDPSMAVPVVSFQTLFSQEMDRKMAFTDLPASHRQAGLEVGAVLGAAMRANERLAQYRAEQADMILPLPLSLGQTAAAACEILPVAV